MAMRSTSSGRSASSSMRASPASISRIRLGPSGAATCSESP
jgi:hypothetical protein